MDRSVFDFNIRLRTIRIRDLILWIIICLIVSEILITLFPIVENNDDLFFILLLFLILLFFIWALKGTTGLDKNFENLFVPSVRNEILYVFTLNIVFAFLFICFISWLDLFFGINDPNWISIFDIDTVSTTSSDFILSAIGSIIFAPVLEELIFRGILFNRIKIRLGIIPAMIISSFLFGIGHDFGGITSAFLFGLCMCILYLKTDNIFVPISVHLINNIAATLLELTQIDLIVGQLPLLVPTTIIVLTATFLLIKYIVQETCTLKSS